MSMFIQVEKTELIKLVEDAAYKGYLRAIENAPDNLIDKKDAMERLKIGYTRLQNLIKEGVLIERNRKISEKSIKKYLSNDKN